MPDNAWLAPVAESLLFSVPFLAAVWAPGPSPPAEPAGSAGHAVFLGHVFAAQSPRAFHLAGLDVPLRCLLSLYILTVSYVGTTVSWQQRRRAKGVGPKIRPPASARAPAPTDGGRVFSLSRLLHTSDSMRSDADSGLVSGGLIVPFALLAVAMHLQSDDVFLNIALQLCLSLVTGIQTIVIAVWQPVELVARLPAWARLAALGLLYSVPALVLSNAVRVWMFGLSISWCSAPAVFSLLFPRILSSLSSSFTLAEASILCQLLSLLLSDTLSSTLSAWFPSASAPSFESIPRAPLLLCSEGLILGMLLIGWLTNPLLSRCLAQFRQDTLGSTPAGRSAPGTPQPFDLGQLLKDSQRTWTSAQIRHAMHFYAAFAAIVFLVLHPWLWSVLGQDPFVYAVTMLVSANSRLATSCLWLSAIGVTVFLLGSGWFRGSVPVIVQRKYFHALAVAIFFPAAVLDIEFMRLSISIALSLFILVEMLRLAKVWPVGDVIEAFMHLFVDARDAGPVVLTHSYLLVGCALPMWLTAFDEADIWRHRSGEEGLEEGFRRLLLPALAGLLSLGVGDAMASLVGVYLGRHRWPGTRKSLEGTLAGGLSMYMTAKATEWVVVGGTTSGLLLQAGDWRLLGIMTAVAMLETFTLQIDNVILPLYAFGLLKVFG